MSLIARRPGQTCAVVSIDSGGHRQRVLAARDALVAANIGLVPPIAIRIKLLLPPSFELADLIAEGNFGLLRAATRYRPREHGDTPFSAFARPRIRGAILDSIRRKRWEENTRKSLDNGIHPRVGDGWLSEDWRGPFGEGFYSGRGHPVTAIAPDMVEEIDAQTRSDRVAAAIATLPPIQAEIVRRFYLEGATIAVIGAALGLSEYKAALHKAEAIAELRRRLGAA
jgi:RNA polymerase sigma-B factor